MNEFVVFHQRGKEVAIRKSLIEAFKDRLVRISGKDKCFEYTVDESFAEIKEEIGD